MQGHGGEGYWLWQTGKGDPQQDVGSPEAAIAGIVPAAGSESFFPSPWCYLRARVDRNRVWKQEAACQDKGGDCLQALFIFVLSCLITSSFFLFEMRDSIVHIQIQYGFLSLQTLLLGRSPLPSSGQLKVLRQLCFSLPPG